MKSYLVVFAVLILSAIGLLFVFNVTYVRNFANPYIFVQKQAIALALGLALMFVISRTPLGVLRRLSIFLLVISFCFVIATLILGSGDAKRWIRLPGFSIQPVEFFKIVLTLFLANVFSKIEKIDFSTVISFVTLGLFLSFPVYLQPDYGNFAFIMIMVIFMLFIAGAKLRYLLAIAFPIIPLLALAVITAPYRMRRLLVFIDPWTDPQGSGFQVIQSLLSYASGGLTGVGIGEGIQRLFFLPAVHNDFIISSIAEEVGFLGIVVIVLLYSIVAFVGFLSASRLKDRFAKLAVASATFFISAQAILNLLVSVALLPTKGLPLPFISYGGSSTIANFIAIGIMLSGISAEENKLS